MIKIKLVVLLMVVTTTVKAELNEQQVECLQRVAESFDLDVARTSGTDQDIKARAA